jgi:hypothetical protein
MMPSCVIAERESDDNNGDGEDQRDIADLVPSNDESTAPRPPPKLEGREGCCEGKAHDQPERKHRMF